jgi:hypothetical protein
MSAEEEKMTKKEARPSLLPFPKDIAMLEMEAQAEFFFVSGK